MQSAQSELYQSSGLCTATLHLTKTPCVSHQATHYHLPVIWAATFWVVQGTTNYDEGKDPYSSQTARRGRGHLDPYGY